MKHRTATLALAALSSVSLIGSAEAALLINFGNAAADGQGPTGADAGYFAYNTPHEQATTGQLETYTGTSFAGLVGTYNVGVSLSFSDGDGGSVSNGLKQSIDRGSSALFADFYEDWIGLDTRSAGGDVGTMTLNLTGLEANSEFSLKTYHDDTSNLGGGTFTTDKTGVTTFALPTSGPAIYDFTLLSDGSGNASIDFTMPEVAGSTPASFFFVNGFDLEYVPEPGSLALLGLGGLLVASRRRRG